MMSNMKVVLKFLGKQERKAVGEDWIAIGEIKKGTGLSIIEISDVVELAEGKNLAKPRGTINTPISDVRITAMGRLWLEENT